MLTVEQKYQWLLKRMYITDCDYWEKDSILNMRVICIPLVYANDTDFDKAIETAILEETKNGK